MVHFRDSRHKPWGRRHDDMARLAAIALAAATTLVGAGCRDDRVLLGSAPGGRDGGSTGGTAAAAGEAGGGGGGPRRGRRRAGGGGARRGGARAPLRAPRA